MGKFYLNSRIKNDCNVTNAIESTPGHLIFDCNVIACLNELCLFSCRRFD